MGQTFSKARKLKSSFKNNKLGNMTGVFPPDTDKMVIESPTTKETDEIEDDVNYNQPTGLNPLELDCIVEMVFSYLDIQSLKTARQVNRCWSIEGAKALLSEGFVSIPKRPKHMIFLYDPEQTLEDFKTFLSYKSKEKMMISKIKIEDVNDINTWKSFGEFGKQVNELQLNIIEKYPESLEELLPHLPNLKVLEIPSMDDFDYDSTNSLHLTVRKIMNTLVSTMSQADANRPPLMISSLNLDPNCRKYLQEVEKLADCPKVLVESFCLVFATNELSHLRGIQTRMLNILRKILQTNQESMKRLILYDCEIILSHLQFPVMSALTTLELNFYAPNTWDSVESIYEFHPSFQFCDRMPNLTEINLYWDAQESLHLDFWNDMFQNIKPVPTVRKMNYSDGFEGYCLDKVLMTFPNLESFEALNVGNFESMAMSIWKHGKKMTCLEFDINLEKIHGNVSNFDYIFTGFSKETVESIRNSTLNPKTIEDIEELRVNPSIWDLEDLQYMTIRFRGDCTGRVPATILSIAGDCAFEFVDVDIFIIIKECTPSPAGMKSALEKVGKLDEIHIRS